MRYIIAALLLASVSFAYPQSEKTSCDHDNCLRAMIGHADLSLPFCATYSTNPTTTAPPDIANSCDGDSTRLQSACACVYTTLPTSGTATPTPAILTTTVVAPCSTTVAAPCTATVYSQIAPAVASCTDITLKDIDVPSNSAIDLSTLKDGAVVTFEGTTTFGFTNVSNFFPIVVSGNGITVKGAPGNLIDGNGPKYWDGQGSNGGVPKPDHFLTVTNITGGSIIRDLNIKNWPVHCFNLVNCTDLAITNIFLNNTDGEAPNNRSNGLPAGHNSDGFDIATSNNTSVTNSVVLNQDDCVAVSSGYNVTVDNMYCYGGHGLSIGSVGGKPNNNVVNVTFSNSAVVASQNGMRIKTNFNTTGFISGITYENISISGATTYGLDIQQDYLNGGPVGTPSNGVKIQNLIFNNVTGTVGNKGQDYYILCGNGSCSNFSYSGVNITSGGVASSCNFPTTTCPGP